VEASVGTVHHTLCTLYPMHCTKLTLCT
jgi:hypothetical protein